MPFQYQPFVNPYGASIGELLAHRNDASAHAAEVIGQAQAHAQEVTGQAFGNAAATAGQAIGGAIQQQTDPRRKLEQQQVDANTRALAYQTTATNIAKSLVGPNGEQPTRDRAGVMMTQAGIPVEAQEPILKSLDAGANYRKESYAEAGHVAYRVIKSLPAGATDEDRAHAASAALGASMASDMISPTQGKQLIDALAQGANPLGMAISAMGMSPSGRYKDFIQDETKPIKLAGAPRPGATPETLIDPSTHQVVATGATTGPAPLTPEQVALDAATLGTPQETPTAKQSATAVALTHQKGPASLEEQLLTAITNGDKAGADRITTTLRTAAQAKKDPVAEAMANALRSLSVEQAQERIEKLKRENAPLDISGSVNTTMSGRKYVDLSEWQTPEDRQKAQQAAVAQGIAPLNKDTAGMLSDLDTARQNQQTMIGLVESKLPKDASGRLLKGPANTIEKLAQTDPELASIGTFRNAAIQSMRAVAGSKGLRINQAEVQLAIDNDIPKLSDTLDSARQKLANLSAFMDNIEKAHLVRDRSAVTGTSAIKPPTPLTLTPGLQGVKDRK